MHQRPEALPRAATIPVYIKMIRNDIMMLPFFARLSGALYNWVE